MQIFGGIQSALWMMWKWRIKNKCSDGIFFKNTKDINGLELKKVRPEIVSRNWVSFPFLTFQRHFLFCIGSLFQIITSITPSNTNCLKSWGRQRRVSLIFLCNIYSPIIYPINILCYTPI